jgi:hypothetical protein
MEIVAGSLACLPMPYLLSGLPSLAVNSFIAAFGFRTGFQSFFIF